VVKIKHKRLMDIIWQRFTGSAKLEISFYENKVNAKGNLKLPYKVESAFSEEVAPGSARLPAIWDFRVLKTCKEE